MRWPFQSKKETDLRIFRDPKTDVITLRLVGPMGLPSGENPILEITVEMNIVLDEEAVQRLYTQLGYFAHREISAEPAGSGTS